MTINTNGAGVAVCSCGHELEIRCTGGCKLPDPVFKDNYIATMKRPRGEEPKLVQRDGQCNYQRCTDDVAEYSGHGRPSTKCPYHLEMMRGYRRKYAAKKAV